MQFFTRWREQNGRETQWQASRPDKPTQQPLLSLRISPGALSILCRLRRTVGFAAVPWKKRFVTAGSQAADSVEISSFLSRISIPSSRRSKLFPRTRLPRSYDVDKNGGPHNVHRHAFRRNEDLQGVPCFQPGSHSLGIDVHFLCDSNE